MEILKTVIAAASFLKLCSRQRSSTRRQDMNGRQTIILIAALVVSALIVWHDLPIEFPWMINVVKLFLKLSVVLGFAVFAFVFTGGKKKAS